MRIWWRRLFSVGQAPEALVRAQKQFAVGGCYRSVGRFIDGVGRQHFERWASAQHEDVARLVRKIDFIIEQERRGPRAVTAAGTFETFFPNRASGLQIQACGDAILTDAVKVAVVDDTGADAALRAVQAPEALALGHVFTAAGPDGDGIAVSHAAAHSHQRAPAPKGRRVNGAAQTFAEPKQLARLWIVGGEAVGEVHNEFLASVRRDDER